MKRRIILTLGILLVCLGAAAQPPETIYLGNIVKEGYVDNGSYGPFNIGFNFTFFGNTYSQFYVNSNGQVLFGTGSTNFNDVAIPTPALPNNFIAMFWDDLVVDGTGRILYTTIGAAPTRKLIIQCKNMGFYGSPPYMGTFSAILYETTNVIQIQYRQIVDNTSTRARGADASIGLENSDGTIGVQYLFHTQGDIVSGKAISYTPSGPTYTSNPDAFYEGIFLTTNISLPEPNIPSLLNPPQDAIISPDFTFSWSDAGNTASYALLIADNSALAGATYYSAGTNLSYAVTGLTVGATYYWGVFATNATGTTWCEIKKIRVSSTPPLFAVPQSVWVEQSQEKTIELQYTGGDASAKTAIIMSLPVQGQLYQYNAGVKGPLISSVPATVTDAGRNVIYLANGTTGNGAGNFTFKMHDNTGDSPNAQITVNVSPTGIPNLLCVAKNMGVEMQFDLIMANPAGKESQFSVTVNSTPVTISSLSLKEGDPYTISATLATPLSGTETVTLSYTAGDIASAQGGWLASFSTQSVTLTAQTITFDQSLLKKFSDSPFVLTASSSSGLVLTYSSSNLVVATAVSNILTFLALGTSDITARQAGDATYAPAKYIKTLTVAIGDQTIAFSALPIKTLGDADFTPAATASSGLSVSFSSNNTAVATIVSGKIHIVGAGSSLITASQAGNTYYNAAASVPQTLFVNLSSGTKTLNLTVYLEGLYNGANGLVKVQGSIDGENSFDMFTGTIADTLTVQLAQIVDPYIIVHTVHGVPINTDGTISLNAIPATFSGNYFIIIKHRNHIETWSQSASFAAPVINYNFTDEISKAWANNMVRIGSVYCIYTGDANKDQYVDGFDLAIVFNLNKQGSFGYQVSDINGDGFIDGFDLVKVFNNNKKGAGMNTPVAPMKKK